MEATAQVKKIITDLFEHKKFLDLLLTEKQEELKIAKGEDDYEDDELSSDVDNLEDLVNQLDDVIVTAKETFELD